MIVANIDIVFKEVELLDKCNTGLGIWFAGCTKTPKCKGCFSPNLWKENYKEYKYKKYSIIELINKVQELKSKIKFDTIVYYSGDEYLDEVNFVIKALSEYNHILYTGRELKDFIKKYEKIMHFNYIKFGAYDITKLKYDGVLASSNQYLYSHKIYSENIVQGNMYNYKYEFISKININMHNEEIYEFTTKTIAS